jgi:hypothetical protein
MNPFYIKDNKDNNFALRTFRFKNFRFANDLQAVNGVLTVLLSVWS